MRHGSLLIHPHFEQSSFMIGRTKVAPLNQESIPKLELQAAVIGGRLCKFTTEESRLHFNAIHFWTDSTTVLGWINSPEKQNSMKICQFLKPNSGIIYPANGTRPITQQEVSRFRTWNNFGCNHQNFYSYQNLIGFNQNYRTTQ